MTKPSAGIFQQAALLQYKECILTVLCSMQEGIIPFL